MGTLNKRATTAYDRSGNNPTHVVNAAHNPYLRDVSAPVDVGTQQYEDYLRYIMSDLVGAGGGGLVNTAASGQASGATFGELGADSRGGTMTELQMLNARKFLRDMPNMQAKYMGRELGLRDQANKMADQLKVPGAIGEVAKAGLGVWGAVQDADEAQQDMMDRKSQADFQRNQQNVEARGLGSQGREQLATSMPGAMARRSGRGAGMNRERIFWNGGY